jgi:hypothetical protein
MMTVGGCGSSGDGTPAPTSQATSVTGGGNADASASDVNYVLGAGNYTYSIVNFAPGDKLTFPAGSPVSVNQESWTDGKVKLETTSTAGTVTVELTGLTNFQDGQLTGIDKVNTLFGAGTVTQK